MASKPTADDLRLEQKQLRACRTGFLLLGAWLLVRLFALVAGNDHPGLNEAEGFPHAMAERVWLRVLLLATLGWPAIWQLRHSTRSPRWSKSWRLAHSAICLQLVGQLGLGFFWSQLQIAPHERVPIFPQLLDGTLAMVDWFLLWWLGVLVAEFGLACRSQSLVDRTEWFGYWVLANVVATLAVLAWILPRPWQPGNIDQVANALVLVAVVIEFITLVVLLRLVTLAAAISRFLAQECDQLILAMTLLDPETTENKSKTDENEMDQPDAARDEADDGPEGLPATTWRHEEIDSDSRESGSHELDRVDGSAEDGQHEQERSQKSHHPTDE